jgi:hypothetical protein
LPGRGTALGAAVVDGHVELVRKLLLNRRVEIRGVGPVCFAVRMFLLQFRGFCFIHEDLVTLAIESSSLPICTMILAKYNQEKAIHKI